jgi:PIN domain-containing protein
VHDERFPADTPDAVWLKEAGTNGWIVLTRDNRVRYHPNECQAMEEAGVLAFILTASDATGLDAAEIFIRALPRMAMFARTVKRPAVYLVRRDARPVKAR